MAQVVPIGKPINESERKAIAYLRDHLPDSFTVIHNFELKQEKDVFEIDIALLGPHCVHVIDVKGTHGTIDVYGSKWHPADCAPFHSPLAKLRNHAKTLKSLICEQHPTDRELRSVHVDAAVLMTAPAALVQDPDGHDAPAVAYLQKCAAFFKSTKRIPDNRSTDIRTHFGKIRRTIVGRAQPKSAPTRYGNWQIEEKLGGTDRYTEYRARNTLLGAERDVTARLRVYPVDPYLPPKERQRERRRIENAFRALLSLPGHAHILTVREFFENESEDRLVLVTEDVVGHALRQHIRKSALTLTFDQKIAVVRDTLTALEHAHESKPQIVHRNLTPDAIIISKSGRTLVSSFDYARAGIGRASTIAEEIVDELDPRYQAPECAKDPSQASVASDLYAAGLVFYELLVGKPAWLSVDDMMEKNAVFPIKPSELNQGVKQDFDNWLQALCAFDIEDRPASAAVALAQFNSIVGSAERTAAANPEQPVAPVPTGLALDYATLQPGDDLHNRFRIEESLGRGGFAVVYRVFDSFADTRCVLKIIIKDRRSRFERLKQEYRILERLPPHSNVVPVIWADKMADDTPFILFEHVPGEPVSVLIEGGPLSPEDSKRVGRETLDGLRHLHANGVYHRDIKPSNLLWTDQGIRIIDFNVAAHIEDDESRTAGTRRYLPPDLDFGAEMSTEEKTDWDLFALGVTLYECATGSYPWDGDKPDSARPRDPTAYSRDLAPKFAQVLLRAIAPRRTDRFTSAVEFQEAIESSGAIDASNDDGELSEKLDGAKVSAAQEERSVNRRLSNTPAQVDAQTDDATIVPDSDAASNEPTGSAAAADDLILSQASLQDYRECRYRFRLRYLDRLEWPALRAEPAARNERRLRDGKAFHHMVHQYLLGVPAERLQELAEHRTGADGGEDPADWWRAFCEDRPADVPGQRFPEVKLAAQVAGRRLSATYDLIVVQEGERAVILDWKTTARRPREATVEQWMQTRVYPYLLARAGAVLNDGRALPPDRIEMRYWFAAHPRQPVVIRYDHDRFEEDGDLIADLVREISELPLDRFDRTERRDRCRLCTYRSLCDRGAAAAHGDVDEDGEHGWLSNEDDDEAATFDYAEAAEEPF